MGYKVNNVESFQMTGLEAETEYNVRVAAWWETCPMDSETGDPDYSDWRTINITTGIACPAPTNLAVTDGSITAREATVTWEGTSNSYVVMIGQENLALRANFEDNTIPVAFTNSYSYPWTVTAGGANGSNYCIIPGNKGVDGSTSDLTIEVAGPGTVSFNAKVSSENNYDWGRFLVDGTQMMQISGNTQTNWTAYSFELTEGTHTLIWRYIKDGSGSEGDDRFYVDDIVVSVGVDSWNEYTTNAQTYTFTNLTPNRSYQVKVKGNCGDEGYSQETAPVGFSTLESCAMPTGLTISNVTRNSAVVSWTGEGNFVLQYGEEPHAILRGNLENAAYDWITIENATSPQTITGLEPSTYYPVRVKHVCGGIDGESDWNESSFAPLLMTGLPLPTPPPLF